MNENSIITTYSEENNGNNNNNNDNVEIEVEETISAPSPIAIFSTTTTLADSPTKKRSKTTLASAANTTSKNSHHHQHSCVDGVKKCAKCGGLPLPKIELPIRMTIGKRIKRFGISIKKVFTEKDCALIVMALFIMFTCATAYLANWIYYYNDPSSSTTTSSSSSSTKSN